MDKVVPKNLQTLVGSTAGTGRQVEPGGQWVSTDLYASTEEN